MAFAQVAGRVGTQIHPAAAYAPSQKSREERKIQSLKEVQKKSIIHTGVHGARAMKLVGWEAANAVNHQPGRCGVSPAVRLSGQRARLPGELYDKGEQVGLHPDVLDSGGELALRFRIRQAAVEATNKHEAEQAVARAVAARPRPMTVFEPGQRVFVYRSYAGKQRERAELGHFLGPGTVIGLHGNGSVWVQFEGRCYLVAREHCRSLNPEEEALVKTPLKNQLDAVKRMMAKPPADYEDLTGQEAEAADLETATAAPARAEDAGEEDDGDAEETREPQDEEPDLPEELGAMLVAPGWHYDTRRRPVLVVDDAWAMRTPTPRHSGDAWPFRSSWALRQGRWTQLKDHIEWRAPLG